MVDGNLMMTGLGNLMRVGETWIHRPGVVGIFRLELDQNRVRYDAFRDASMGDV